MIRCQESGELRYRSTTDAIDSPRDRSIIVFRVLRSEFSRVLVISVAN